MSVFLRFIAIFLAISFAIGVPLLLLLTALFGHDYWVGIVAAAPAVFVASFVATLYAAARNYGLD